MPNIASVFKAEISRIARKEVRAETDGLKKQSASYRSTIAALRKQVQTLERAVKKMDKPGRAAKVTSEDGETGTQLRFSAKGLAAHRQRLGISAADMAKLMGVSALSVYKWESGKTRPRAAQIAAIASVRKLGKREVAARLEELGG